VYSSILVFLGVLSSYVGVPWIEPVIAVIISGFILKTGVSIGKNSALALMDAVLKPEHISKIRRLSEEVHGVIGVHDIKIRKSGPFCFGEMHMEVEEGLSVERAHAIAEEVERKAKQECAELETLVIHMEPAKRKKFRIAIPIEEDKGLESTPNRHFGSASHFIIIEIDQGQIKNWTVKPNPGAELSKKRGINSADFLISEGVNILLAREMGEGPFHVLRDGFVEIYNLISGSKIREIIEDFLKSKLEKVVSPKDNSTRPPAKYSSEQAI
jgi:predicted Fe-Mo cluster-binding NifX family protein